MGKEKGKEEIQDDVFGQIEEGENAFGVTPVVIEKESEEEPEKEIEKESGKEPEKEPEKEQEQADEAFKVIEEKSPSLAGLIKKKGFKNLDDLAKTYEEAEKELSRKSQKLSDFKSLTEKYIKFDDEGNILGFTDEGKSLTAPAQRSQGSSVLPTGGEDTSAVMQELKEKFWEAFENNPIETLAKIITTTVDFKAKDLKGSTEGYLKSLEEKVSPILKEYEERQRLKLIDEVADEQVKQGDEKAQEFIDEYADDIAQELGKIDADLKKANPKLAIRQAYLTIKDRKVREFQEKLKKKQQEEIEKEQGAAETGVSSGGGSEPKIPEELQQMEDAIGSRPNSAFFNI
ncbi:MAG: hypothetical protein DRO62_02175 [Candidatus Altiarchaeales archaeon]|nr:MAG: hypothetical protein DRO62_02175 [Candidatus Altiarchaeales archaeon]